MNHNNQIFEFFNSKFPFNQEGLTEFSKAFKTKTYKKGSLIVSKDETENQLRFVSQGIVREYFAHEEREMNTQFYLEGEFTTDFHLLLNQGKRRKYQESLTDTTIKQMDSATFYEFMERYKCGKEFVDEIFSQNIMLREQEEFKHFSLTPDELYLDLLNTKPQWLQQIPLYHIATYLRMTPETLSRIRKRN